MKHMDVQLQALDDILSQVRVQNSLHHDAHVQSLGSLSSTVKDSYVSIGDQLQESTTRANNLQKDVSQHTAALTISLEPLGEGVQQPLADLRSNIQATCLTEYTSTGSTPQKVQYTYVSSLPQTESHTKLLSNFRKTRSPSRSGLGASPTKSIVFTDAEGELQELIREPVSTSPSPAISRKSSRPGSAHGGLREVDINVTAGAGIAATQQTQETFKAPKAPEKQQHQPPLKRQNTGTVSGSSMLPPGVSPVDAKDFGASVGSKLPKRAVAEGRENVPFGSSIGAGGRSLRNRGS